jgi:predicted DNA repair protein MutK
MAGASLLALIDDIAAILDDVAVMTKVAAQKTAGVLGDDLALNAQQVAGVRAERELPVVWAVCVGSLKNKLILVPAALAISALLPWAITPLLMAGGVYLCCEGVEKIVDKFLHGAGEAAAHHAAHVAHLADASVDMATLEREKIRGAIRTDFVLSAEIIVIALGTVAARPFATQATVLAGVGLLMTVGVYGIVAAIVKMDDLGLHLVGKDAAVARAVGRGLLLAAPRLMKTLTVVGTLAMFLVGGGILSHGLPGAHDAIHRLGESAGGLLGVAVPPLADLVVGLVAGALALAVMAGIARLRRMGA